MHYDINVPQGTNSINKGVNILYVVANFCTFLINCNLFLTFWGCSGLQVEVDTDVLQLEESVTVSARISGGVTVNYTWNWGDGSNEVTVRQGMDRGRGSAPNIGWKVRVKVAIKDILGGGGGEEENLKNICK